MTKFIQHTIETAPDGSKAVLDGVRKAWGFVPQLQATLAESPLALGAYDSLFNAIAAQATLSPAEQQLVYLAINVFHGCEYCTSGHTFLARKSGLDESVIQALRNETPIAQARLEALRAFALAVVHERGSVGDAAVDAFIGAGFSRAQVLEVVTIIATKTISNYTNHLAHTPKEGFMADPSLAWTSPRNRKASA